MCSKKEDNSKYLLCLAPVFLIFLQCFGKFLGASLDLFLLIKMGTMLREGGALSFCTRSGRQAPPPPPPTLRNSPAPPCNPSPCKPSLAPKSIGKYQAPKKTLQF